MSLTALLVLVAATAGAGENCGVYFFTDCADPTESGFYLSDDDPEYFDYTNGGGVPGEGQGWNAVKALYR